MAEVKETNNFSAFCPDESDGNNYQENALLYINNDPTKIKLINSAK